MNRICILAVLLTAPFAASQGPTPTYEVPPAVPPASCALALASIHTLVGPSVYKRLAIQLKALQSAQDGVKALAAGLAGSKNESSPALAMSSLFTGTEQAHEALLCSASIVAKQEPVDQDDENARTLLIVAYNQEAAAISDLEALSKEQFLRLQTDQSQATMVKDAERMTAISSLQQEAASTLSEVTTLSLLMSVDSSNPKAKDTKQTLVPCARYDELKTESTTLARQKKSAYTDAASLFVAFLNGHRCK